MSGLRSRWVTPASCSRASRASSALISRRVRASVQRSRSALDRVGDRAALHEVEDQDVLPPLRRPRARRTDDCVAQTYDARVVRQELAEERLAVPVLPAGADLDAHLRQRHQASALRDPVADVRRTEPAGAELAFDQVTRPVVGDEDSVQPQCGGHVGILTRATAAGRGGRSPQMTSTRTSVPASSSLRSAPSDVRTTAGPGTARAVAATTASTVISRRFRRARAADLGLSSG